MTDRDALYRAVLDNPEDDTLRLVYADALEESGDPRRAAFVRQHVELSRVPHYDPGAVQAKYHNPKKGFAPRWLAELPPLPDGLSWARDPFRRGLPGAVRARDGAAFVAHAAELFDRYPIESLELAVARVTDTAELAACPYLNRLRSLSLAQGAGGAAVRQLLASEHLDRLTTLHLGAQMTTAAAVQVVVRSPVFARLTELSVREDRPGGGALVGALARLPNPPRLTKLDLSGNRLTAETLRPLLASSALRRVETFDLSDNNLGADGLAALAATPLPSLKSLYLLRTRPTVDGVQALVGAAYFPNLCALSLGGNNLPATAATWVANADGRNMRELDLRENRLGDRGVESLSRAANLGGLLVLDLAEADIADPGADLLARSEPLAGLLYLNLYGNPITAPAAGRLRKRFGDRVFLPS